LLGHFSNRHHWALTPFFPDEVWRKNVTDHGFKEGDEVQHKTGKIKMIYVGESQLGKAICEWVDPSGKPQSDTFSFVALQKYERSSVGFKVI
jgi:uncharacterized protein YodC (DUF2158 family)